MEGKPSSEEERVPSALDGAAQEEAEEAEAPPLPAADDDTPTLPAPDDDETSAPEDGCPTLLP